MTNSTSASSPNDADRGSWQMSAVFAVIILAAVTARVWAAQDEFWLDEIWSLLAFTRIPHSFWDIFTFHHDNNHYLVTMWMDVVGPAQRKWFVYRIPSVAAGSGTVLLAGWIARRWGRFAAFVATLLTASSFVLIVYGSEARGYALAGFFSLLAFLALDRYLASYRIISALGFAAATLLGVVSHLTFVQFYCGALAWSLLSICKAAPFWRQACWRLIQVHALPAASFVALYVIDIRMMRIGGGEPYRMLDVVASALALAVGCYAEQPPLVLVAAICAASVGIVGIVFLVRERSDLWAFFAAGFVIAPALLLGFDRPTLLYERYFYVNLIYFLILLSYLSGRLVARGPLWRAGVVLGLATIVCGNVALAADFLRVGRGHYLAALEYITEQSADGVTRLAGDDDFDNTAYLGFYANYLPEGHQLFYINFNKPAGPGEPAPQWLLIHGQKRPFEPNAEIRTSAGATYRLVNIYPCGRLSGYSFALYRRG